MANIVLEDPNVKQVIGQKQGVELSEIMAQALPRDLLDCVENCCRKTMPE